MTIHLNTQADLEEAVTALVRLDPRLKPVLERTGMPALRRREPGFAGLGPGRTRQLPHPIFVRASREIGLYWPS
jgi:3-methyladenine DNA glycosylase/8-oxoguanine DNA glycosylase